MEELDRIHGDFALDHAVGDLGKIAAMLPRIQDKLKILEAALSQVASSGVDEGELPEQSYGYIPLDLNELFDCLFDLETALKADSDYKDPDLVHHRVDFVEAGCGSGRNIFLIGATDRFEFGKLHGFDLSKPLVDHGRLVFGLGENIIMADCMKFDFAPMMSSILPPVFIARETGSVRGPVGHPDEARRLCHRLRQPHLFR